MEIEYKFKEKYNPKSNRLDNYDYSSNGGYFITICTKDREEYFGKIINGEMILNEYGNIVFNEIKNIDNIDEFIIMPNHIHLILFIEHKNVETSIYGVSKGVSKKEFNHYGDALQCVKKLRKII